MPYVANPIDAERIHYEVEGVGPPLVLLHAFMQDLEFWRIADYTEALRDRYQLILVDDRGHGRSDKPHNPAAYVMERRVADIVAVLDDIGIEHAYFWGYSMGGYIGFGMLELAPERLLSATIGGSHPYPLEAAKIDSAIRSLEHGMEHFIESAEESSGRLPEPFRSRRLANDAQALIASLIARRDQMPGYASGMRHANVPILLYAGSEDLIHDRDQACATTSPSIAFISIPAWITGEPFCSVPWY